MVAISRRTLLQLATAGTAVAFLTPQASASNASTSTGLPSVESAPGAIAAYLAKMPLTGITTVDDIRVEYQNAIEIFPLILPAGWRFPADPGLFNAPAGYLWQRGSGANAAYVSWHQAVTAAAYSEHQLGRADNAKHNLDLLEAGYGTDVRKAAIDDPGNFFLNGTRGASGPSSGPLASARTGDFAALNRVFTSH